MRSKATTKDRLKRRRSARLSARVPKDKRPRQEQEPDQDEITKSPSLFDLLPPEIVHYILTLVPPHQLAGFTCASRLAREMSDKALQLSRPELKLDSRLDTYSGAALRDYYTQRAIRELETSCEGYVAIDDDPDL